MKRKLQLFILGTFICFYCKATIINVPGNYPTIQSAILATVNGDTVLVEQGIYFENINFRGHKIVLTSRFYLNKDTAFIKSTIINGSQPVNPDTASCVIFNSGEDSTTVLQGFTITGGTGTAWFDIHGAGTYREGGGVLIELCSPIVQNNLIIYNNVSPGTGVLSSGGGGIRIGDGHPVIRNNVIAFNTGRYGAGIVLNYTGVLIENNLICYNSGAQDFGGAGIWASGNFTGYDRIITNNTIVKNNAINNLGGGLFIWGIHVFLTNNIIWGNTAYQAPSSQIRFHQGGSATATYNDVQTFLAGSGNISADPLFADTVSFYLTAGSPASDAGDSSLIYNDVEDPLNQGNALFPAMNSLRNDMGAYGGTGSSLLPLLYFMPAGLNEQLLLESYFQTYPNPAKNILNVFYILPHRTAIQLEVADVTGKLILSMTEINQIAGIQSKQIDVSNLEKGLYILKINSGSSTSHRKFIKQ